MVENLVDVPDLVLGVLGSLFSGGGGRELEGGAGIMERHHGSSPAAALPLSLSLSFVPGSHLLYDLSSLPWVELGSALTLNHTGQRGQGAALKAS